MGEKHRVSDRKYRDHRRRTRAARAASLQPSHGSWIKFKTFRLSRYVCQASGSAQMCQTLTPAGLLTFGQPQLRAFWCAWAVLTPQFGEPQSHFSPE